MRPAPQGVGRVLCRKKSDAAHLGNGLEQTGRDFCHQIIRSALVADAGADHFVQHNAHFFEAGSFLNPEFLLFPGRFNEKSQSPEEMARFLVGDGAFPVFQGDLDAVPSGNGYFNAAGAGFELQQFLRIFRAEGQALNA